jgi:JmjC domain, hydroxylase/jmjN domain
MHKDLTHGRDVRRTSPTTTAVRSLPLPAAPTTPAMSGPPLEVPEFRPTLAEFEDFLAYVKRIEPLCPAGAATIVPPPGWRPRRNMAYDDLDDLIVRRPIRQEAVGSKGVFVTMHVVQPKRTLAAFRAEADSYLSRCAPPPLVQEVELYSGCIDGQGEDECMRVSCSDDTAIGGESVRRRVPHFTHDSLNAADTHFWRNVMLRRPTYGADLPGSLFDDDVCESWNLKHLGTVLDLCPPVAGIHTPYLYVGSYGSLFCFHVEDSDLYGINYLHIGAPKTWYTIPVAHRPRFETLCQRLFPDHHNACKQFLRHKQTLVSLDVLRKHNIPYGRVTQVAGTFTIVMSGVFHCGLNTGFNVAEAVNFATMSWLSTGMKAAPCTCREDTVRIDVESIDRHLFPGKYTFKFARKAEQIARVINSIRTGKPLTNSVGVEAKFEESGASPTSAQNSTLAMRGGMPTKITPKRPRSPLPPAPPPQVFPAYTNAETGAASNAVVDAIVDAVLNAAVDAATRATAAHINSNCFEAKGCVTAGVDVSARGEGNTTVGPAVLNRTGQECETSSQAQPPLKRRRNWAPIARMQMADFSIRDDIAGEEAIERARLDRASMCGVEIQLLAASTLLNTINIILRDSVESRTIAALGRRISRTRRRFLNVQTGMFKPVQPGTGHFEPDGCGRLQKKNETNSEANSEAEAMAEAESSGAVDPLRAPCNGATGNDGEVVGTAASRSIFDAAVLINFQQSSDVAANPDQHELHGLRFDAGYDHHDSGTEPESGLSPMRRSLDRSLPSDGGSDLLLQAADRTPLPQSLRSPLPMQAGQMVTPVAQLCSDPRTSLSQTATHTPPAYDTPTREDREQDLELAARREMERDTAAAMAMVDVWGGPAGIALSACTSTGRDMFGQPAESGEVDAGGWAVPQRNFGGSVGLSYGASLIAEERDLDD